MRAHWCAFEVGGIGIWRIHLGLETLCYSINCIASTRPVLKHAVLSFFKYCVFCWKKIDTKAPDFLVAYVLVFCSTYAPHARGVAPVCRRFKFRIPNFLLVVSLTLYATLYHYASFCSFESTTKQSTSKKKVGVRYSFRDLKCVELF